MHQHTVLHLPACHRLTTVSPSVMPAPSQAPLDSYICSVRLHPHISHSSALASATVRASSTPADPNTHIYKNSCSSTGPLTPCPAHSCVWSRLHLTAPMPHEHPGSLQSTRGTVCRALLWGHPCPLVRRLMCRGHLEVVLKCDTHASAWLVSQLRWEICLPSSSPHRVLR